MFKRSVGDRVGFNVGLFCVLLLVASVSQAAAITRFWLVDANADVRLSELKDYQTLQLPVLPTSLSIEAETDAFTESVVMKLNGVLSSTENAAPYALAGDSAGNFVAVPALRNPGWVTISAQPFTADNAGGIAGTNAVLHLYINQPNFFVTDTRDVGDAHLGDGICSTYPDLVINPNLLGQLGPLVALTSVQALSQSASLSISQTSQQPIASSATTLAVSSDLIYKLPLYLRGGCTLRAAIEEANATAGTQNILVDGTRGRYFINKGRLNITSPMTITGYQRPAVDAQRKLPGVFYINGGGTDFIVNLDNLEITGGYTDFDRGGGIWADNNVYLQIFNSNIHHNVANFGGGIYLQSGADLHMWNTAIHHNQAGGDIANFGGGGVTQRGGGISNIGGNVTIDDSSIYDNDAVRGGGISNFGGRVEINNSSILNNRAASLGGGIESHANNGTQANLQLNFVTVAYNQAGANPRDPLEQLVGGGIYNTSWAYVANSIIARNTDFFNSFGVSDARHAPDCYSPTLYNLKSYRNNTVGVLNAQCSFTDYSWGGTSFMDVGSPTAPLNPLFTVRGYSGDLAFYNLTPSSPALNNAASASAGLFACDDHDMINNPRPVGSGCDRGAIERQ